MLLGLPQCGEPAVHELLRRIEVNELLGNADMHLKNLGLIYRDRQHAELAPAYDITHAYRPGSEWVAEHQMSINGKFDNITRADVRTVAERFDLLAELPDAIENVRDAVAQWPALAKAAEIDPVEIETIHSHMVERAKIFAS